MRQAFILAAGLGTRLRPLTDTMPKALVPILGKPLLQHQIERLRDAGFQRIIVNIHHFGQQIIDFLEENYHFGLDISVSDERDMLLDTGGALRHAMPLFDSGSPVLVHNVDILHNLDLGSFYDGYDPKAEATLLVSQRKTSRYLSFDDTGRLTGWTNTSTGEVKGSLSTQLLAFSGIHVIQPSLVALMSEWPSRFSIIDFYLQTSTSHVILGHHNPSLRMLDVGKVDSLASAEQFFC